MNDSLNLYCISGLGADHRAFGKLKLDKKIQHIEWISPLPNEPISDYAKRLAKQIDTTKPFGLIGLSFGGMIAREIAEVLPPKFTILISSFENRAALPTSYKMIGKLGIIRWIPTFCFRPPKRLIQFLFGTKNTKLLYPILKDSDPYFIKWALHQLSKWQLNTTFSKGIHIKGDKDRLIKKATLPKTIIINGGHHFMIIDRAQIVSKTINDFLKQTIG